MTVRMSLRFPPDPKNLTKLRSRFAVDGYQRWVLALPFRLSITALMAF